MIGKPILLSVSELREWEVMYNAPTLYEMVLGAWRYGEGETAKFAIVSDGSICENGVFLGPRLEMSEIVRHGVTSLCTCADGLCVREIGIMLAAMPSPGVDDICLIAAIRGKVDARLLPIAYLLPLNRERN